MKRRKNIIIIVGIVLLSSVFGFGFLREASRGLRIYKTDDNLKSLSMWIEIYREDEGHYPHSLTELPLNQYLDEKGKLSAKDLINQIQHNPWHDSYDYKPSTNGFTIVVTGPDLAPAGWFGKQRKIEKHYEIGEALKEFEGSSKQ